VDDTVSIPQFDSRYTNKMRNNIRRGSMTFRNIIHVVMVLILSVGIEAIVHAENTEQTPAFDADLAKRLGGDEHGMKSYVLVILKTGPNDATIKGTEREQIFAGHMANIGRLSDEGKLAVAGPFGENDKGFRGIFILNVAGIEEAQQLAQTDPAIKAGVFVIDLFPWYGSASLMATPEIHKKITKPED
jgi:uncharacterized protein YciI